MTVTDSRDNTKESSIIWDPEIVKCITWNVKLNQGNKDVLALLDSGSKANLIFQAYVAQLPSKITDISYGLTTINKQQISTQDMVIASFEMTDG